MDDTAYNGKFHYPPEIDQYEGPTVEKDKPVWQNVTNGFYYRPKSALVIKLFRFMNRDFKLIV